MFRRRFRQRHVCAIVTNRRPNICNLRANAARSLVGGPAVCKNSFARTIGSNRKRVLPRAERRAMTRQPHFSRYFPCSIAILCAFAFTTAAWAADSRPAADGRMLDDTVNKAIEYLRVKGQAVDGSYSAEAGPAVTALVTAGVLRSGRTPDDPLVAKSLAYLERFVREDGGIYAEKSTHPNYETCIAIQCFAAANRDHRYEKLLKNAENYVKGLQRDVPDGKEKSDVNYGGAGYGNSKRPDLSNTSFLLDALKSVGRGPDDDAVKRRSSSFRAARTWRPSSTRRRSPPRIPMAGSITRQPPAARARPAPRPKADCAAMAR